MAGSAPIAPQVEETNVLDFQRSRTVVQFFLDLCDSDLDTLIKYYNLALRNAVLFRMQNTMRVRQNDKYLTSLEMDIGRLENRWVLPLTKATNVFESAVKFSDTPPREIKPSDNTGVEVVASNQSDVQSKTRWLDEPAITMLKAIGVKPYRNVMRRLQDLRQRRTQYKYLELYFLNLGRSVINLQANLRLVVAVIQLVKKVRNQIGANGQTSSSVDLGQVIDEIVSSNTLEDALNKIKNLNPTSLLGPSSGPAGNPTAQPNSAAGDIANARQSNAAAVSAGSGIKAAQSGQIPTATPNPGSVGPTGINSNTNQRSARNL